MPKRAPQFLLNHRQTFKRQHLETDFKTAALKLSCLYNEAMYKIHLTFATAAVLVCYAFALPGSYTGSDGLAETRTFSSDVKNDGSYNYQFDTSNGIVAQESGQGGYYASGSSQYYSPESQLIQLTYTADENGFHPSGDHLPTPPPIPEDIIKALEYIRTHPHEEEHQAAKHQQHVFHQKKH